MRIKARRARRRPVRSQGAGQHLQPRHEPTLTAAMQTIVEAGDNLVSTSTLYGAPCNLFARTFPQPGITVCFAEPLDPAAFAALIHERTQVVYCELVGNPLGNVTDIVVHSQTKYLGGHGASTGWRHRRQWQVTRDRAHRRPDRRS